MTDSLTVPNEATKYILFQRTAYLRFPVTSVYRCLNRFVSFHTPLYNIVVAIESRIGAGRIKRLYQHDMEAEYASFQHFLPEACRSVLDIGCGVAGINVFIQRHYGKQGIDFYLLDKTQVTRNVFYLYQPRAAFYNSLVAAKAMLVDNGISAEAVHPLEANDNYDIPLGASVDLVLSLLAWGFHFPVQTYVNQVFSLVREGGVVILDVRKKTDGLAILRRVFSHVELIVETNKYDRVVARK